MANLKISNLPIATSLEGLEPIVVVQNGVTKQSTVQNILNYITPTSLVVSAGQVISLQDALYETSELIELSWSGSNGTMVLNLPIAASNVNRVMRFISNSGFGAGTQNADLTPQGGDTLDGSTNKYRINKAYEGIQVWSNGVEWFISTEKRIKQDSKFLNSYININQ